MIARKMAAAFTQRQLRKTNTFIGIQTERRTAREYRTTAKRTRKAERLL